MPGKGEETRRVRELRSAILHIRMISSIYRGYTLVISSYSYIHPSYPGPLHLLTLTGCIYAGTKP